MCKCNPQVNVENKGNTNLQEMMTISYCLSVCVEAVSLTEACAEATAYYMYTTSF